MKGLLSTACLSVILSSYTIAFSQTVWSEYSQNPVLDVGVSGSWDDYSLDQHGVLLDGDTLKLWYSAQNGEQFAIGYAYSSDGLVWAKFVSNPVFTVGLSGTWDDEAVKAPKVLYVNGLYRMWYRGCGNSNWNTEVGYAESTNGTIWIRHSSPVLTLGDPGSWEALKIWDIAVIFDEGLYKMWYTAQDDSGISRIGYATSSDGIAWTKYGNNPVFDVGNPGWWDDGMVYTSAVLHVGSEYEMWYAGGGVDTSGMGYATSMDGIEWVRYDTLAPIWSAHGEAGGWDELARWSAIVLYENSQYSMWYNGMGTDSTGRIGYASSPVIGVRDNPNQSTYSYSFNLLQNYPNPFNPFTHLSYMLPVAGFSKLSVYDVQGCKVSDLVNGWREAGLHSITFDGSNQPSGIYFYRIEAGGFTDVKKMVLVK